MYKEDFAQERKDHESMHARLTHILEELTRKEMELGSVREMFEEELQVKNQQVMHYKKQLDAYKADLDKCWKELRRRMKQV